MLPTTEAEKKLLEEIVKRTNEILLYEPHDVQNIALEQVPLEKLSESAAKKAQLPRPPELKNFGEDDLLILELLRWFKFTFFKWVDKPNCDSCSGITEAKGPVEATDEDRHWGAYHVENYFCAACQKFTRFPRYKNPLKLLDTKKGRCGEWASCFTLFCRSLGYEARLVFDWADHVWTEIFSVSQNRWLHCDPCENTCDNPLMYELGWKKTISYVLAFSKDEVQDVTWRYCSNFEAVMRRRTLYREIWLLSCLLSVTSSLQSTTPDGRKQHLLLRKIGELAQFLTPKVLAKEYYGRSSGSQEWRESRGEYNPKPKSYIFILTAAEISNEYFNIKYSSSSDKYIRVSNNFSEEYCWDSFVFEEKNIFRKVENDWNMAYLARKENCDVGVVRWKFDFRDSGLVIDVLTLTLDSMKFESGCVKWMLVSEDVEVELEGGPHPRIAEELHGQIEFTITAELTGGVGQVSWQHAQLFRQNLDSAEFPFEVEINFLPRSTAL